MSSRRSRQLLRGLALGVVAFALACATNPATGKKQLNLYSEAQEIALGREADQAISAQLGLVDDPELAAWVSGIGRELAAGSERPDLPWSFQVVDDPVVNAFALPGGFIYVTRGLIVHLRNEAELAGVIGHEIGHVTAQHSVNQMSKQQLAAGGLLIGMIAAPELARYGDLAQSGLGLLFLKYGRDDERQADDLGLRYMAGARYETREMPGVFEVLRRVSEMSGQGRIPSWLASHPDPEDRLQRSRQLIDERSYPPGETDAETFLRRSDGLVFGADPRQGYFDGSTFYHPGLGFTFDVPAGWAAVNETRRVVALHPDRIAQLELRLAPGASPDEAARGFLGQQGVQSAGARRASVGGLTAVEADFSVPRQNADTIVGSALFVELGGAVFQLTGLALEDTVGRVRGELGRSLGSFGRLTDRSRLEVEPRRVRVVELPRAMTFDEFLRSYPSAAPRELLELINGVDAGSGRLERGRRLKTIEGREIGSQRIGTVGG